MSPKLKGTVLLKDALLENIKQSVYQVGRLWRECFDNVVLPGPELWGWISYSELWRKYFPRWQQEDSQIKIQEFVSTCGCKTSNCVNFKCGSLGKNVWTSTNFSKKLKTTKTFFSLIFLMLICSFLGLISASSNLPAKLFFDLRSLCCNKQW